MGMVLMIMLMAAPVAAQDIGLPVGAKPTPVKLEDVDGKPFDMSSVIGKKPVLLEFWATWCPLCKALEPQMAAAKQKYGDKLEVIVVAVGVNQSPRSIKRHMDKHALPGRVLWDGEGAAVRAFEAPGTSYVVLLDKTGKVSYTGAGSEQKLLPVIAKVVK